MPQEIKRLLKSLREKCLVGLITNGPSAGQWEKVDRLNLKPLFDVILVSGDLPWEKPQKRIFQEACDMLGVVPSQTIMIGDKLETDIQGGINARVGATIWIPPNNRTLNVGDPTPDMIIKNVTELKALIPHIKNLIKEKNGSNRGVCERMSLDAEDCNSNGSDGS
ncbi:unnamed protein product [Callosobruchus maculatus]|uniref:N-acylneuraminate-9-phosphatase n=1 Tax=Callosobruchus maculatus TaxID=64391 RepID=A0A653C199_CALMS|nr:unnamed protein product [Callosobruchus maculatus]